jgi:hypothetical protein
MVSAIALGAVAVWLIVTADNQKGTRVGALIGFWAMLLAAFAAFGTRSPVPAQPPDRDVTSQPSGELARVEDATARREYEYRLMEMLRREITATMSAELVTLRADVAALRSELVEKVGGQIRLERIETTRVIGSDIEALQHEVRQMMNGRRLDQFGSFSLGSTHTSLVTPAVPMAAEPLRPEPVGPVPGPPAPPTPPAPLPPEPIAPQPTPEPLAPQPPPEAPAPEPVAAQPPLAPATPPAPAAPLPPAPVAPPPVAPVRQQTTPLPRMAEPILSGDPFASMPRLRPFTDFELDPTEVTAEPDDGYGASRGHEGAVARVNGGSEPTASNSGRHTNVNGDANGASTGGRRRRAADSGGDDVLARILSREGSR